MYIFKTLLLHKPQWGDFSLHLIFLILNNKFITKHNHVGFMYTIIGRNNLNLLCKLLEIYILKLRGRNISNKMGHGVAITHMANALVLVDYGIQIS